MLPITLINELDKLDQVRDECGQDALSYAYSSMGEYAKMMDKDCHVNVPSVSLTTGCSEPDMVQYLSCESTIDSFSFRPISIIGFILLKYCIIPDIVYKQNNVH
uniref:Transferrin-like domain-containing protein n=1 Tax=Heterorhabditis bacteriophora TaxID=37862 RepID=A0A1I7X2T2_HETBA